MNNIALKIENVTKEYRLGAIGGTTFREEINRLIERMKKKFRKQDETDNRPERFMALNGVSFEVKKGERIGIIGRNGAGKSTLLKLLSRVTGPTCGTIQYNGKISSMLEVGTGFHPELTGRENIYMNGAILGMSKKEIDGKIDQIIEFAEMRQFIDTPVKRYSSGMYVKLAFAVAAHLDNDILIMDEVLAVGDMKFQQKCLGKMDDASKQEGKTVLFVSHNMNLIRQLCSRCIVLDKGKVIYDGDVEKAISYYVEKADGEYQKFVDLTKLRHSDGSRIAELQSVEIMNADIREIKKDEPVVLKLGILSHFEKNDIRLRCIVHGVDDSNAGMSISENSMRLKVGKNFITAELDLNVLAPNGYYTNIILYVVGDNGGQERIDIVDKACYFRKEYFEKSSGYLNWVHSSWGNANLPKIKIIQ